MEWYRVYHGMPNDPKLQVIAKRSGQPMSAVVAVWVSLLDAASQHDPRGVVEIDPEEIAVIQDIELVAVQAIIKALYAKGMLNEQNRLTGWDKRQYENSTERSRKFRDKKKHGATPNNTTQRGEAQSGERKRKIQPDTEADTDSRTDSETETKKDLDSKNRVRARGERERGNQQTLPDDITGQMLQIWNAEVQSKLTKGQNARITPQRRAKMLERWQQDFQQDIRAWRYFCEIIGNSDFCLGKIEGKNWTIDLGWAVESSDHVAKILEGGFSGGNHPPKPPVCDVPGLQQAWDAVLDAFKQKHGKACCRSWLANTVITGLQGNAVIIRCPSGFARQWIIQHYLPDLTRWWRTATEGGAAIATVQLIAEGQS